MRKLPELQDTLITEMLINPKKIGLPEWINQKEAGYNLRVFFETSLDFLLHKEPKTKSMLRARKKDQSHFDLELFYQLIPDMLTSVMLDNKQANFQGFFSTWMMDSISTNYQSIGHTGLQKILKSVSRWEEGVIKDAKKMDKNPESASSLSQEKLLRGDLYTHGTMKDEFAGFKNGLKPAILASQ